MATHRYVFYVYADKLLSPKEEGDLEAELAECALKQNLGFSSAQLVCQPEVTVENLEALIDSVRENAAMEQSDWDTELATLYTIKSKLRKGLPLTVEQYDFILSFY